MSELIAKPEGADVEQRRPRSWKRFETRYPAVAAAYDELREVCRAAGPLDDQTVALVKLAISVGATSDRAVHIHTKKALRAGLSPDALRRVAIIAMPAIGLPRTLDALQWIEESIEESRPGG